MHAVVVNTRVTEEAVADPEYPVLRQQLIPAVSQAAGFLGGYWLKAVDGLALAVVVFESEVAARGAAEAMGAHPGASLAPGATMESVEFIEVIGNA